MQLSLKIIGALSPRFIKCILLNLFLFFIPTENAIISYSLGKNVQICEILLWSFGLQFQWMNILIRFQNLLSRIIWH